MSDKTTIFLHGFDTRSVFSVSDYFKNQCKSAYCLAPIEKAAEISIADIDSQLLDEHFVQKHRFRSPNQPLIVISSTVFSNTDPLVFVLKKPLIYEEMEKLLKQMVLIIPKNAPVEKKLNTVLVNHLHKIQIGKKNNRNNISNQDVSAYVKSPSMDKAVLASLIGRQSDVDVSNPQAVMRVVYDPSKTILTSIKKAMDRSSYEQRILELTNLDKRFIIDPFSKTIFTFVSESVLRPICLLELRETSSVKKMKKGRDSKRFRSLVDKNPEVTEWSWESFLWKMALWTSRGKIPRHLDINKPVYLSEWPNFTRLQIFPHALKIAAVMKQQVKTLSNIVAQLGIDQRYVFGFFSAAYILGIADTSKRQSDQLFQPSGKLVDPATALSLQKILDVLERKNQQAIKINKLNLGGRK